MLLSSHMLGEVVQVADDVVVVDRGRLVRRGTLADVAGPGDPASAAARLENEFLRLTTGLAGQDRR